MLAEPLGGSHTVHGEQPDAGQQLPAPPLSPRCAAACPRPRSFLCTGHPAWDALGSISVGVLMGAIALQLMKSNKRFLIGGWEIWSGLEAVEHRSGCVSSLSDALPLLQAKPWTRGREHEVVEHLQNDDMPLQPTTRFAFSFASTLRPGHG